VFFEYEKKNISIYFIVKKLILLLQKICAQICALLVTELTKVRQGFISCDNSLCHFWINISLEGLEQVDIFTKNWQKRSRLLSFFILQSWCCKTWL